MTSNNIINVSRTFFVSERRLLNGKGKFIKVDKLPGEHTTKLGYDLVSSQHLEIFK